MKKALLCLTFAYFTAASSHAALILVNFGTAASAPTGLPETWNNFSGTANGSNIPLNTSTNGSTGYTLTAGGGDATSGINTLYETTAVPPTNPTSPFTPTAVPLSAAFQTGARTFTLTGLDPALTYSISLYSYINRTDSRGTRFSINGTNVNLEPARIGAATSGAVAYFENISPTAGTITINVTSTAGNNWILNAMSVSYVPEPSTALLGLAGMGIFCACRRRA